MSRAEPYNSVEIDRIETFDTDSCATVSNGTRPLREATQRKDAATRQRIPNKIQWGLAEMLASARCLRAEMDRTLLWIDRERIDAKGKFDHPRVGRLGELSQHYARQALRVAELERIAANASAGRYEAPIQGQCQG